MANHKLRGKTFAAAGVALSAALLLSACSSNAGNDAGAGDEQSFKVGISQFVQHPALDSASEGFKQAFFDAGYVEGETVTFDEQNANGEVPTATTISQTFATSNLDLAIAIATPSAQALLQNNADIPLLFAAVTDPVATGLLESNEKPGANMTGVSDMNPVADQIDLITEIKPDTKRIGIVYGSGEANSEVQVALAKEAAKERGLEIVATSITNASELKQAVEALSDIDAIYTPSDNLVASGLGSLISVAEDRGILVVGADSTHVEGGAVATLGIDYLKLGHQAGEMALRILEDGADPATMPVESQKELSLVVNPEAAKRQGVEIPAALLERADSVIE
ncbi:ABC transporter substrate-binding protein [Leucobacter sp. cx-42]|uniref:ABC transporter substrate-binding protein n=1 Tax=unclassified Leucobacter TaxID=2621730 RepID=UPI00165D4837|nr:MULTISPECIES: ABC transporter substrate-binding protein [unclassified Leucobacter]MBC9955233.1 ABC transporter substrate-binding protein [Leucobacter sp. cx-42]